METNLEFSVKPGALRHDADFCYLFKTLFQEDANKVNDERIEWRIHCLLLNNDITHWEEDRQIKYINYLMYIRVFLKKFIIEFSSTVSFTFVDPLTKQALYLSNTSWVNGDAGIFKATPTIVGYLHFKKLGHISSRFPYFITVSVDKPAFFAHVDLNKDYNEYVIVELSLTVDMKKKDAATCTTSLSSFNRKLLVSMFGIRSEE